MEAAEDRIRDPMKSMERRRVIEAVLFLAEDPVPASDFAVLLEVSVAEIESDLNALAAEYQQQRRGIVLRQVAGGWRLLTDPETAPFLERFIAEQRHPRLTRAALETLAIIAYRQPISRAQVAQIRGVSSESVIRTLIARGLVQEVGREPAPGLPVLYGTTPEFLERLGIDSLTDLPSLPEFMPGPDAVERMEAGLGPGI
jgi:segregation and condensation protein B